MTEELIIEPYVINKNLPYCQIYDIDGTLALKGDRGIFEWDKVDLDLVNKPIQFIYDMCAGRSPDKYFLFSGRVDICRAKTIEWLEFNVGFHPHCSLMMRKDGDFRPDTVIKYELFNEHIRDKYNVRFVMDDRPSVCRMWRKLGVPLLQVGDPYIEF